MLKDYEDILATVESKELCGLAIEEVLVDAEQENVTIGEVIWTLDQIDNHLQPGQDLPERTYSALDSWIAPHLLTASERDLSLLLDEIQPAKMPATRKLLRQLLQRSPPTKTKVQALLDFADAEPAEAEIHDEIWEVFSDLSLFVQYQYLFKQLPPDGIYLELIHIVRQISMHFSAVSQSYTLPLTLAELAGQLEQTVERIPELADHPLKTDLLKLADKFAEKEV